MDVTADLEVFKMAGVKIYTVGEVEGLIKEAVDRNPRFQGMFITGEIMEVRRSQSRHLYFTLKDVDSEGGAILKCIIFRSDYERMGVDLESSIGKRCVVQGNLGTYKSGLTLKVYSVNLIGKGDLYVRLARLREKLSKEGLFDESRKRPIPKYPKRIGIVTSPKGAAVGDILHVLAMRYPMAEVIISPAAVQGEGSAEDIARGIERLNTYGGVDVIIVTRGGGSMEDLWGFNEEVVVRAVASSAVPVISAVGHERNFTLCDEAADARASTPTKAGEIIGPSVTEIYTLLRTHSERLTTGAENIVRWIKERLRQYAIRDMALRLRELIDRYNLELDRCVGDMSDAMERLLIHYRNALEVNSKRLEALNPRAVMERGYARVEKSGKAVKSVTELDIGDNVDLALIDGTLGAEIKTKRGDL